MVGRLHELEKIIGRAFIEKYEALDEIRRDRLFGAQYGDFKHYLHARWELSWSWWEQTRASVRKAKAIMKEHGVILGNENAARKLRAIDDELVPAIVHKAQALAGRGNPVLGRHVAAVVRTLTDVCCTDGFVDDGTGEMVAFDAACQRDVFEATMRDRQRAIEGAKKNGWEPTIVFAFGEVPHIPFPSKFAHIPLGTKIEIKWRVVPDAAGDGE